MLTRLLYAQETSRYTSMLFIRLVGVIYVIAFASLSVQIIGLVGEEGILPIKPILSQVTWHNWFNTPTLFLFGASDMSLLAATYIGICCGILLFIGIVPVWTSLAAYILYLSLFHAGQIFLKFQWDTLLLETGLLTYLLALSGPRLIILLMFEWLLFRFRFLSGLSKLVSGDPSWHQLSALDYYFETQPLPHIGSWYAHFLPQWCHTAGTAWTLLTELIVPFFIFLPRKWKITAALLTVMMQIIIIMTSNHAFVNLLVIVLCLLLIDDKCLHRLVPILQKKQPVSHASRFKNGLILGISSLIIMTSLGSASMLLMQRPLPQPILKWVNTVHQYGVGYSYHIFPTMQTSRQELVIEGSQDGKHWQSYEFKYKPGELDKPLAFIVPHHPRLDWMMWFVPTQANQQLAWFRQFLHRLKQGSPAVLALLKRNPFPAKPPRFLRVKAYQYRFNTLREKEQTGHWWRRKYLGVFPYIPPRIP